MLCTEIFHPDGPGLADFAFPQDRVLLVVGDVHGQADALRRLLDGFGGYTTPGRRRTLVFLGDLIDRGPDSLGCLQTALGEASSRARADEIVHLPGNHELLLADALEDAMAVRDGKKNPAALGRRSVAACWTMNGGMNFLLEVLGDELRQSDQDTLLAFAERLPHPGHGSFLEMVRTWPSHYRAGDALCVHAGLAPKHPFAHTLDLAQRDHFPEDFRTREISDRHWAWIRDRFLAWQGGWREEGGREGPGCLVLHGHTVPAKATPEKLVRQEALREVLDRSMTSARICLDGGAARGVAVAGAILGADGVRLCLAPVQTWHD